MVRFLSVELAEKSETPPRWLEKRRRRSWIIWLGAVGVRCERERTRDRERSLRLKREEEEKVRNGAIRRLWPLVDGWWEPRNGKIFQRCRDSLLIIFVVSQMEKPRRILGKEHTHFNEKPIDSHGLTSFIPSRPTNRNRSYSEANWCEGGQNEIIWWGLAKRADNYRAHQNFREGQRGLDLSGPLATRCFSLFSSAWRKVQISVSSRREWASSTTILEKS